MIAPDSAGGAIIAWDDRRQTPYSDVYAGHVNAWYFYDPEDLGAVAKGLRKPWEVLPDSWTRTVYPRGIREGTAWGSRVGDVTGACFDAEAKLLYIDQRFTIDNGSRELFPAIHVYRVR